jgi:NAD(P)-dependent dehydrogenase (short-subunit alcohol dehydrogenase family)
MGLATAQRFVAEGAYVFLNGRRPAALDEAVKQIGASDGRTDDAGTLETD